MITLAVCHKIEGNVNEWLIWSTFENFEVACTDEVTHKLCVIQLTIRSSDVWGLHLFGEVRVVHTDISSML